MDEERRSLIVTAAVGLLVLAIIIGSVYYLVRFIQSRQAVNRDTQVSGEQQQTSSPEATGSPTNLPQTAGSSPGQQSTLGETDSFKGAGFEMVYPKNWGVLTCNNSNNFELDPANSQDSKIACDVALKPVTVLVGNSLSCEGEAIRMGGHLVARSSEGSKGGGEISYRWCVVTDKSDFDITHRVSQSGSRATSKLDVSQQIEEMISKIKIQ